jgi:hypothetical protein
MLLGITLFFYTEVLVMIINGGYQKNEFINYLNNKSFDELSSNLKTFVKTIYPNIRKKDVVFCKKYNGVNVNIIISVNGVEKYVALKSGNTSVLFKSYIYVFMLKMKYLNVSTKTISSLYKYHRGYANNDYESFGSLHKEDFKEEIAIVKNEFENKELLSKVIDMILFEDKKGVKVDFFYYGNIKIGHTLSTECFKDKLLNEKDNYPHDYMRIGPFNFLPVDRKIKADDNTLCQLRINNLYKYFK